MQQLKLFSLLLLSSGFFSACSGNADGKNNQAAINAPKASDSPASSSASDDAVFSYNLNGIKISGGKVDVNQAYNTNASPTSVSGTFFGKVKLLSGQPGSVSEFIITDGKFNIPYSDAGTN